MVVVMGVAGSLAGQATPDALRDAVYAGLAGEWTGQLEYRDYTSNERVTLPTWLEVKDTPDGRSLELRYTYDDGPAKVVTETATVTIDAAKGQYTVTSEDHSSRVYRIEGVAAPGRSGRMQFALAGKGTENDKPVDVRIKITIEGNLYRFEKETRVAGQEFAFRDGYVMTRRNPVEKK